MEDYSTKDIDNLQLAIFRGEVKKHNNLKEDSVASRTALCKALKIKELPEIIEHQKLKGNNLRFSFSHTKKIGAVLIDRDEKYKGIGLDIELNSRIVSKKAIQRFSSPQELSEDHFKSSLYYLSAKEAAYKALWPIVNKQNLGYLFNLKSISLFSSKNFKLHGTNLIGTFKQFEFDDLLISIAYLL